MAEARQSELETPRSTRVVVPGGEDITIPLEWEDDRAFAVVVIDGVRYHLERVLKEELTTNYKVDLDPDYQPQADTTGHCYMLAPFSR